jgi:hypothetical protein
VKAGNECTSHSPAVAAREGAGAHSDADAAIAAAVIASRRRPPRGRRVETFLPTSLGFAVATVDPSQGRSEGLEGYASSAGPDRTSRR